MDSDGMRYLDAWFSNLDGIIDGIVWTEGEAIARSGSQAPEVTVRHADIQHILMDLEGMTIAEIRQLGAELSKRPKLSHMKIMPNRP